MHKFVQFLRKNKGTTAVEFAFVAPIFFLLFIGIIEVMVVLFAQSVLEGAITQGSRTGKTGLVNNNSTRNQTIVDSVMQRGGIIFNAGQIQITTTNYGSYGQIGVQGQGSAGAGGSGDIVVYEITYPWHIYTPLIGHFISETGDLTLSARAVVKNEPF